MEFAEALAVWGDGGLPARLLKLHVPDSSGHCAACTYYERPRPKWPCNIHSAAERALKMRENDR